MKALLLGPTGYIGSSILSSLVSSPSPYSSPTPTPTITSLLLLTRSPLPSIPPFTHPKITSLIHPDFTQPFSQTLLERLQDEDVDVVFWALGTKLGSGSGLSEDELRKIEVGAPLQLVRALREGKLEGRVRGEGKGEGDGDGEDHRNDKDEGRVEGKGEVKDKDEVKLEEKDEVKKNNKKRVLRFIYVSGKLIERNQEAPLWFGEKGRKMKGEVEKFLERMDAEAKIEERMREGKAKFEGYVVRPAMVTAGKEEEGWMGWMFMGSGIGSAVAVRRDELGAGMVELGVKGGETRRWENGEIAELGRKVLGRR